jgi:hypothetical protein
LPAVDPRARVPGCVPLELGDRAQDVHLQLGGRCGGVDAFGQADECDTERLQLVERL